VRLEGDRVVLRPLTEGDIPWVGEMLAAPEIARWWHEYDEARIRRDLFASGDRWFAIELEGEPVGAVGTWEEPEPDYRHAGIDISLAPRFLDQGLGADAVRALARWLFEEQGHHRVVIDPATDNARAIRCYERVGFRAVGVMRSYERDPAGGWRDGLLMDLLPEDLRTAQ
jgi:aminoglycoside 6'-N-acetyltransferase